MDQAYLLIDQQLKAVCVWPDAIPILMPKVDMVYVGRRELAPKKFLRAKKDDACLVEQSDLDGVLTDFEEGFPLPARHPRSEKSRSSVRAFVQSLSPFMNEVSAVSQESVLNAEYVEAARQNQA